MNKRVKVAQKKWEFENLKISLAMDTENSAKNVRLLTYAMPIYS